MLPFDEIDEPSFYCFWGDGDKGSAQLGPVAATLSKRGDVNVTALHEAHISCNTTGVRKGCHELGEVWGERCGRRGRRGGRARGGRETQVVKVDGRGDVGGEVSSG